jgi:hypothetical protein
MNVDYVLLHLYGLRGLHSGVHIREGMVELTETSFQTFDL